MGLSVESALRSILVFAAVFFLFLRCLKGAPFLTGSGVETHRKFTLSCLRKCIA